MSPWVYLNGQFMPAEAATISPLDRGFLFADAVYEVIPVYQAKPFCLTQHLQRLQASLAGILLAFTFDLAKWQELLTELIDKNGGGNQAIYLQISRGAAQTRSHTFPAQIDPTVFIMSLPFTPFLPAAVDYAGEKAISHEDIRWHRCHLKTTSLLPNVLLSQQAKEADAIEVILVRDGVVTEGSASNVFAVIEGVLMTHPQGPAILGGITRDVVLELAEQQQLKVQQQPISLDQLRQAEEVWISSSTKEIRPVVELDGQPVAKGKPGAYWRKVAQAYQERRDQ